MSIEAIGYAYESDTDYTERLVRNANAAWWDYYDQVLERGVPAEQDAEFYNELHLAAEALSHVWVLAEHLGNKANQDVILNRQGNRYGRDDVVF